MSTKHICESLYLDSGTRGFTVREDEAELANHDTPASELLRLETISEVRALLRVLPKRTREIIVRRYGLRETPESQSGIGRRLGISKQRICQLEEAAIQKLRAGIQNGSGKYEA
jgi:RNA polymerase sigma factor (sigma-70 family)